MCEQAIICPAMGGKPCEMYGCAFFNDSMGPIMGTYACQVFQAMKGLEKLGNAAEAIAKPEANNAND